MATRPAGTTDAMWWFWQQVDQLEPQAQLSGTRVYKTGYHGPVEWMRRYYPDNYSIQRGVDLVGPLTAGRAIDISYADARAGRTLEHKTTIIRVTKRVAAAVERRDPRMYDAQGNAKVREVIGTIDGRNTVNCSFHLKRVTTRRYDPDDSHLWHNHVSVTTKYVDDPQTYRDLLDIMFGDLIQEDDMFSDADRAKLEFLYSNLGQIRSLRDGKVHSAGYFLAHDDRNSYDAKAILQRQVLPALTAEQQRDAAQTLVQSAVYTAVTELRDQLDGDLSDEDITKLSQALLVGLIGATQEDSEPTPASDQ